MSGYTLHFGICIECTSIRQFHSQSKGSNAIGRPIYGKCIISLNSIVFWTLQARYDIRTDPEPVWSVQGRTNPEPIFHLHFETCTHTGSSTGYVRIYSHLVQQNRSWIKNACREGLIITFVFNPATTESHKWNSSNIILKIFTRLDLIL